ALIFGWGVYWSGVFSGAKTAYAWTEERPGDPWYLRAWDRGTSLLPRLVAWLPRLYGRIWRRGVASIASPSRAYERSPYELTGLAIARLVRAVPGLYLVARPLIGVAAAHIVLGAR